MTFVFTSVGSGSKSAFLSPALPHNARGIGTPKIAGDSGIIFEAAPTAVRPGQAWKLQQHRYSISAVGGSPTSGKETRSQRSSGNKARRLEYDVVIVGAGIIGIATAHHILRNTSLSVALIDAAEPCAGATGAGQGYIWMAHRTPGTPGWALASRSKFLWEELAAELQAAGVSPLKALGWRETGSLLVGATTEEAEALQQSVGANLTAGVPAQYMLATEVIKAEPALSLDQVTAAAFFPNDSQIDAALTVTFLLERIRPFSSSGRYKELFQKPVSHFLRSPTDGRIRGVQMEGQEIYCKNSVVVATGAWSSTMMSTATAAWGLSVVPPVKPRKGHLLVLGQMENVKLRHGIMEFEYFSHQETSSIDVAEVSVTQDVLDSSLELAMTATLDQNGNLLLGSSREFVGFDNDVHADVVASIISRAKKFLWGLSDISLKHSLQNGQVRTGLRPFIQDGRPLIGSIEDVPGLIFATGHEGSGLCLALATAEMVVNIIQDVECTVESNFFSPVGRLLPSGRSS